MYVMTVIPLREHEHETELSRRSPCNLLVQLDAVLLGMSCAPCLRTPNLDRLLKLHHIGVTIYLQEKSAKM